MRVFVFWTFNSGLKSISLGFDIARRWRLCLHTAESLIHEKEALLDIY